jgi:hypothetical protein
MSDSEQLQTTEAGPVPATRASEAIGRHEKALLQGDLSDLTAAERRDFYAEVVESMGLNPMTKPLEYIYLNGELTLYANKTCANQLRDLHGVSVTDLDIYKDGDLHTVYAYVQDETGRTDVDAGIVDVSRKSGEALANARMKAITKAKRRATLSICGLGFLDSTEVEDIPDGATQAANIDHETGEIQEHKPDWWYGKIIGRLKEKVREGVDPDRIIASYDEMPESHPVEEWPDAPKRELDQWMNKQRDPDEGPKPHEYDHGRTDPRAHMYNDGGGDDSGKAQNAPSQASAPPERQDPSQGSPSGQEQEHRFDGPQEAIEALCPEALDWGGQHIDEDSRISEAQLNRLLAIADDEGWKDSWLDRLVKDELGYESKTQIPWGDPYDEIVAAVQDGEMRYFMSRDPDTPDMFEGDESGEEEGEQTFQDPDDDPDDELPF